MAFILCSCNFSTNATTSSFFPEIVQFFIEFTAAKSTFESFNKGFKFSSLQKTEAMLPSFIGNEFISAARAITNFNASCNSIAFATVRATNSPML